MILLMWKIDTYILNVVSSRYLMLIIFSRICFSCVSNKSDMFFCFQLCFPRICKFGLKPGVEVTHIPASFVHTRIDFRSQSCLTFCTCLSHHCYCMIATYFYSVYCFIILFVENVILSLTYLLHSRGFGIRRTSAHCSSILFAHLYSIRAMFFSIFHTFLHILMNVVVETRLTSHSLDII